MIRRFCSTSAKFIKPIQSRSEFELPINVERKKWYPKHMSIQMAKMEGRLRSVDLVVEVHDARVPFTGRNPVFRDRLFTVRPHILVLNKRDLIDMEKYRIPVEEQLRSEGVNCVLWTDCKKKTKRALDDLTKMMIQCLQSDFRFNRTVKAEYQVMVVGIPNCGKSSLINGLRTLTMDKKKNAVKEGARPGVTVRLQNRVRIMDKPLMYILDTPGVLNPYVRTVEENMKLGLCENVLESTLNMESVSDYLLYWLNKQQDYSYLKALNLEGQPTDDIRELLTRICQKNNLVHSINIPGKGHFDRWNYKAAIEMFLKIFRKRELDDCFLDKDKL
ncbi:unnamed protein product [Bursaphelenchus okinawaensis]|uniref:Mitochondrial GTPase 1 n=1 Tax=Bursaphelenchus okinawaensis TaxID=465554 RepID=A0A811LR79_9BILA|nr:unnamed protein product [Bursaphelenchus okinawaensis]CAG9126974.1 unnamed protein product [Bursaphelenchus okinawaensis]